MGDGLHLKRRRQRKGPPGDPVKRMARATMAIEMLRAMRALRQETMGILSRGFWGRFRWLLFGM